MITLFQGQTNFTTFPDYLVVSSDCFTTFSDPDILISLKRMVTTTFLIDYKDDETKMTGYLFQVKPYNTLDEAKKKVGIGEYILKFNGDYYQELTDE